MKLAFVKTLLKHASGVGNYVDSELRLALGRTVRRPVSAYQCLEQWLGEIRPVPVSPGRILITALRNRTWIEWAVYCACVLRCAGHAATLVYDGTLVKDLYPALGRRNFFRSAVRIPDVQLLDLAAVVHRPSARWVERANEWGPVAVAYDHHIEEADVRAAPERYRADLDAFESKAAQLAGALDLAVSGQAFSRAICYSGVIGESKLLLEVLRAHAVETVCLEGWAWRPGHMIYNLNAPALEYNVRGWMESLGPWDAQKEEELRSYLNFLDGLRPEADWLDNFYRIQRDAASSRLPPRIDRFVRGMEPVFVAAPNVIGDSSMLRRETIFAGQQEWLRRLVEWFAVRPRVKLVVRAHPAEEWIGAKCAVRMAEVARSLAGRLPNVLVIGSEEPINTFSLVPFARAGLVWLSSAGVDFVVRGLPAVAASRPKYSGLGIVAEPASQAEYFDQMELWSAEQVRPTPEAVVQAKRYLHTVFKGFSFEATSREYRASGCRLGHMPNQAEHDRFYRILAGTEPMPDIEALRLLETR